MTGKRWDTISWVLTRQKKEDSWSRPWSSPAREGRQRLASGGRRRRARARGYTNKRKWSREPRLLGERRLLLLNASTECSVRKKREPANALGEFNWKSLVPDSPRPNAGSGIVMQHVPAGERRWPSWKALFSVQACPHMWSCLNHHHQFLRVPNSWEYECLQENCNCQTV